MKALTVLPDGYREIYTVDLQKNKKMALLVNLLAVVIAAALVLPAAFSVPFAHLFDGERLVWPIVRLASIAVLAVLYMITHELIHGAAMRLCGTKKVRYGFTGWYAFAGSDDYYAKGPYLFIALAPIVLLGVLLAVVNLLVPVSWFWVVYLIQIINLSGAAGDLFVTVRFLCLPKDILVRDWGVSMKVYAR